jgi:hypothetical protein
MRYDRRFAPECLRRAAASFNKAPEPTPTAVTPRAIEMSTEMKQWIVCCDKARVVPAAGVAHL